VLALHIFPPWIYASGDPAAAGFALVVADLHFRLWNWSEGQPFISIWLVYRGLPPLVCFSTIATEELESCGMLPVYSWNCTERRISQQVICRSQSPPDYFKTAFQDLHWIQHVWLHRSNIIYTFTLGKIIFRSILGEELKNFFEILPVLRLNQFRVLIYKSPNRTIALAQEFMSNHSKPAISLVKQLEFCPGYRDSARARIGSIYNSGKRSR